MDRTHPDVLRKKETKAT